MLKYQIQKYNFSKSSKYYKKAYHFLRKKNNYLAEFLKGQNKY